MRPSVDDIPGEIDSVGIETEQIEDVDVVSSSAGWRPVAFPAHHLDDRGVMSVLSVACGA